MLAHYNVMNIYNAANLLKKYGVSMEFFADIDNKINALYDSTIEEERQLRHKLEAVVRVNKTFANIRAYMEKKRVLHLLALIEKDVPFLALIEKDVPLLKKMRGEGNQAIPEIERLYRMCKEKSESIFRHFPKLLEDAFATSGLSIDPTSRHPTYTLEKGFFRLEIDAQKRIARLSDHECRLAEFPADIQAIVEIYKKEHKRIFERKFNGKIFLKRLRTQYEKIIKKEKLSDGASVPIRHLTRRLGKNTKKFRTDEFLFDLSRLAVEGPFEIEGRRLDLQQTKDTSQGMLLHNAAERGYVGFIVFKEVRL
jgi:hypothetical protein